MSEEQLSALLAKLKEDAGLQEKLKGAADLDAVVALAKEEGFDVSKADWLKYQANQTLELSDEELERVSGGGTWLCTALLLCPVVLALSVGVVGVDTKRIKEVCVEG
jgi:predicted ribosomally synthesized peptide with nif11-like leader